MTYDIDLVKICERCGKAFTDHWMPHGAIPGLCIGFLAGTADFWEANRFDPRRGRCDLDNKQTAQARRYL